MSTIAIKNRLSKVLFLLLDKLENFRIPVEEQRQNLEVWRLKENYKESTCRGPVLRDDALNRKLEKDGFVKLPEPVLSTAAVTHLKNKLHESTKGNIRNLPFSSYMSIYDERKQVRKELAHSVISALSAQIPRLFVDYKPVYDSFFVKKPGPYSYTLPHQHFSITSQMHQPAVFLWVALSQVTKENGALGFVKGSHKLVNDPLVNPVPHYQGLVVSHEAMAHEYMELVPLHPGEAVVFDNRIIHGAPSNNTEEPRISANVTLVRKGGGIFHYFLPPDAKSRGRQQIKEIQVDESFLQNIFEHSRTMSEFSENPEFSKQFKINKTSINYYVPLNAQSFLKLIQFLGAQKNGLVLKRENLP